MRHLLAALAYIADPASWSGPLGIAHLLTEHVTYSLLGVLLAAAVGVPLGWAVGHSGRGRDAVAAFSGAARALPTLGLVTALGLWLGIGLTAPLLAFAVLALPSVLAGAYAGVESADRRAVDAARAAGMTELQVLARVEVPLGAPLLVGGLRAAVLQVIATATLAAYTGAGGLGRLMFLGLKTQDYPMMLASALLVIALALVSEIVFAPLHRLAVPAGSRPRKDAR
ncbi:MULTISPECIES: ABC transporter permease subunit [unclassified Actinomyces]|uniref:ABC transporter permease n=1 Tax=unclassified Actinomyces TaxID=2609248 RepID=UPI002017C01C|nr:MULTISPECIES: ABC transporter permease subunit [unclassified Actinomyces]MCL3778045.1 ABC transporter permease subunit [Actinomyces sp. AC-20-1]MCL3789869.1 ABC transporter permease subunit [Actinomyces sp. 187325]MCL3792024.1 ABC transporter permease subunit [Actinomyces sp. 186855]MCL3794726.1 ABC transporter permease subunit [Actinomyces sp. 217892]